MKPLLCSAALVLPSLLTGCNTKGIPVEYAHLCDAANNKKVVSVEGYLKNTRSVMCSKSPTVPRMTCPIAFLDAPGSRSQLNANIDLGKGSNEIDKEGLTIKDDRGQIVGDADRVTLTGKVSVFQPPPKDGPACYFLVVKKIEKR